VGEEGQGDEGSSGGSQSEPKPGNLVFDSDPAALQRLRVYVARLRSAAKPDKIKRPVKTIIPHPERVGTSTTPSGKPEPPLQTVTWLLSSVTAPFRAKALPVTLAPVFRVMLVSATMFPARVVPVPRVAELPTCQNTPQLDALLMRRTDEALAVVSVLPILKMKTALELPCASSVSVPVNWAEVEKQ
jgi:hypothetical protein